MFGETPLVVVESPESLAACAEALSRAPVVGVDTEADSFHHYQEKVCLLQLSDLDTDYVIDPLSVPDLSPLGPIFANPEQVKIFHGADYDVVSLKRDFGFQFANLFDTMIASQFAGLPRVGLADLIETWFGHVIDKKYQRHDWASRPLLPEHLDYARGDTHFLPALRDVLMHRLRLLGRLGPVMEECEILAGRSWQGRGRQPGDVWRVKGIRQLDAEGQRVLRALFEYREAEAKAMDRPVFKVIPDPILLDIAHHRPTTLDALAERLRRGSPLLRRHGARLVEAVSAGLADPTPLAPPVEAVRSRTPEGTSAREQERIMERLKEWRNRVIHRTRLPAVAVVPNSVLKEVARRGPRSLAELAEVAELRRWQLEAFGEELVAEVSAVLPETSPEPAADGEGRGRRRRRRRRGPREGGEATEPAPTPTDEG